MKKKLDPRAIDYNMTSAELTKLFNDAVDTLHFVARNTPNAQFNRKLHKALDILNQPIS
jgi:hypothetical protein